MANPTDVENPIEDGLCRCNFTEMLDRHFSLGSHLNARDVKAVRKTVSGLVKIVYPPGRTQR